MTDRQIHVTIRGGLDEHAAAAVIAAVQAVVDEESARRAEPARRPIPPAWVRAGRWSGPERHPADEVRPDPGINWPG